VGVGAGVRVARAFGRKDLAELLRVAATDQALAGGFGLLTASLMVAFSQPLLRLVGAEQKLAGTADPYFRLYAIAAVVLNTALRLVLVLDLGPTPSLGVAGVGLAIKALGVTLTKLLGLRALRVQTETVRLQHQRAARPQVSSQIKTFAEYRRSVGLIFIPGQDIEHERPLTVLSPGVTVSLIRVVQAPLISPCHSPFRRRRVPCKLPGSHAPSGWR